MAIEIGKLRNNNIVFLKDGDNHRAVRITKIGADFVDVEYLDDYDCFIGVSNISPNQLEPVRLFSSSLKHFGFEETERNIFKDKSEYTTFELKRDNQIVTVVKTGEYHLLNYLNGVPKLDKKTLYLHELQNIINSSANISVDGFRELTKKYNVRML